MKTSCGKFLNLAHYFPYDVKLRLLTHSRSFLANQKARNAIVGAENLLNRNRPFYSCLLSDLPLNSSEAGSDLVLIKTSLLLLCKSSCSYAN